MKRLFVKTKTDIAIAELANEYGGLENFHAELKAMEIESQEAWSSDSINIGKILKAHLYTEYYLNKYLLELYKLKEKKVANLSFDQKIKFIDTKKDSLTSLLPAINKFNKIRNNMAHDLGYLLTIDEANYFKNIEEFKSYFFITKTQINENSPVDVYELFSKFIAQRIGELLNPRQHRLDHVMNALAKDVCDIYF